MCHEYADLRYLKREAEERTKRAVRETTPRQLGGGARWRVGCGAARAYREGPAGEDHGRRRVGDPRPHRAHKMEDGLPA